MRNTDTVAALSALIKAAKTASEIAPVLESRRQQLPIGYSPGRPLGGVARPVEELIVAHEARGVSAQVDIAVNALDQATMHLQVAIEAMNTAMDRWEVQA